MKRLLLIFELCLITCTSTILFCACQASTDQTNTQSGSSTITEGAAAVLEQTTVKANEKQDVISDNRITQRPWKPIYEYAQFLGKSMFSIVEDTNSFSYYWSKDGFQYFEADDLNVFLFTRPAWEGTGTCSAIVYNAYNALPNEWDGTENSLKSFFGDGYSYHKSNENKSGYYEYDFQDFKVLFYQDNNSSIATSENSILLRAINEDLGIHDITIRDKMRWYTAKIDNSYSTFDEYSTYIGKPKDEIINSDFKLFTTSFEAGCWGDITTYPGEYYIDNNGVVYRFESKESSNNNENILECGYIFAPVRLIFPQFSNPITMRDLVQYGVISWGYGDRYTYDYENDKVLMAIPSDKEGNVDLDDYVMIKD